MLWPSSSPQLSSMDECLNLTALPIILPPSDSPISAPPLLQHHAAFEYNTVVILAAMSCAVVCVLGLHSVLYCVVPCTRRAVSEPVGWFASRRLNGGLKRTEVAALPVVVYAVTVVSSPLPGCAICLVDFSEGDKIKVIPACRHRFHVRCIDKWLLSHCSCPTCRCCLSGGQNTEQALEIVTAA